MKFGSNNAHGVERLWFKFGDFIIDRNGDINFSLSIVSVGQVLWRMREME